MRIILGAIKRQGPKVRRRPEEDDEKQEKRLDRQRNTLILVPLGVAPWLLGHAGATFGIAASALGAMMIALAWRVRNERGRYNASKRLFAFSILYLFVLFAMLLVDRMSGGLFAHFAA